MQTLLSWLTSQSFVSLLVALIALGGVFINNRAAEKRRQADQRAADQRRREDQADEDARRKADDDRRERERREQLQREDYERQRRAVADCIRKLRETEAERKAFPPDLDKLQNLFDQYRYYLKNLDLDVTHPEVCKCLEECFEKIDKAESILWKFRRINGGKGWPTSAVTNVIEECPEALHRSAREHLHFPYDK